MKIWKIIGEIVLGILITICIVSFAIFLYFTELLDIKKIVLKEGIFKVIDIDNEFEFSKLSNKPFNIVVRFYKQEDINYSSLFSDSGLVSGKVPYTIVIDLKDCKNKAIKKEIKQNSFMPAGGYTNKYFEWTLMQFNAKKGEKYKVKINFNSTFKDFDRMKKEIYVEQDYDPPAKPFWYLFQRIFLIIFIITFIPILIMCLIFWRKKRK